MDLGAVQQKSRASSNQVPTYLAKNDFVSQAQNNGVTTCLFENLIIKLNVFRLEHFIGELKHLNLSPDFLGNC